jgi:putative sterol carrier protein
MCYRVKAEPAWGIDKDIIFGMFVEKGELTKIDFFSEADALKEAEYVIAATPQEWKKILRKQSKFLTDFMLGKIKLEHGSKVGVLADPGGSAVSGRNVRGRAGSLSGQF